MTRIFFSLFILISVLGMGCGPEMGRPPTMDGGAQPPVTTCDMTSVKFYDGYVYGDETFDGRISRLEKDGAIDCDRITGTFRNAAIVGQYTTPKGDSYWWISVIPRNNLTGTTENWLYSTCVASVTVYQPNQPSKTYGPTVEGWVGQGGRQTLCMPL